MNYVIVVTKYKKGWYLKDAWFMYDHGDALKGIPRIVWTGLMDKAARFQDIKEAEWLQETYLKKKAVRITGSGVLSLQSR